MIFFEIYRKYKFDRDSDRIGPDCPFIHWKLYFNSTAKSVCNKKFKKFGENAQFRPGAYAVTCSKISIGNNVVIRPGSMLFADPRSCDAGTICIGDKALVGSGVHIYTANHKFDNEDRLPIYDQGHSDPKSVFIGADSWIGANVIILPGVTVGKNAVIGAGSVVTKNVDSFSVACGVPAKTIRRL